MGIGIWYEMFISDPVAYLFKNADPRGSLAANVSNATVRCLSNMPLGKMLADRHEMSRTVRDEVTPKSNEWGYQLGSVYIRKVHFRDPEMIRQIESKVVNRLRQVTAAIKQDGANQVSIITSTAERQAAVEFGKAAAVRPAIVGKTMADISQDADVAEAMFELLETQRIVERECQLTLLRTWRAACSPTCSAPEPAGARSRSESPPCRPRSPRGTGQAAPRRDDHSHWRRVAVNQSRVVSSDETWMSLPVGQETNEEPSTRSDKDQACLEKDRDSGSIRRCQASKRSGGATPASRCAPPRLRGPASWCGSAG